MKGRVELVEFIVREDSALAGLSLAEVYRKFQIKILVCAVKRGQKIYIPDGEFILEKGDKMHIVAAHQDLKVIFPCTGTQKCKSEKGTDLWWRTCMFLSCNAAFAGRHAGEDH